jgi:hypothetical protein
MLPKSVSSLALMYFSKRRRRVQPKNLDHGHIAKLPKLVRKSGGLRDENA